VVGSLISILIYYACLILGSIPLVSEYAQKESTGAILVWAMNPHFWLQHALIKRFAQFKPFIKVNSFEFIRDINSP